MARRTARLTLAVLLVVVALATPGALGATAAGASQPLPSPTQDPATSRAKADEILARPEFRKAQPNLVQRMGTAVTRWLSSVVQRLFMGGIGAAAAWFILTGAALAVAALAILLTRDVRAGPSRGLEERPAERRRSPVQWRQLAEEHESRGEWKQAVRCRYRALVADLVARRAIRDLPGRTTGEYRSEVSAAVPEAGAAFGGASELFERAWYGNRPTGPTESERFRSLADQVLERVDE